jgi:hypothetical protein
MPAVDVAGTPKNSSGLPSRSPRTPAVPIAAANGRAQKGLRLAGEASARSVDRLTGCFWPYIRG